MLPSETVARYVESAAVRPCPGPGLDAADGMGAADEADYQVDQLGEVEGLGHEPGDRWIESMGWNRGAHHHHRDVAVFGARAELAIGIAPIEAGHHHIHQHEIRALARHDLQ